MKVKIHLRSIENIFHLWKSRSMAINLDEMHKIFNVVNHIIPYLFDSVPLPSLQILKLKQIFVKLPKFWTRNLNCFFSCVHFIFEDSNISCFVGTCNALSVLTRNRYWGQSLNISSLVFNIMEISFRLLSNYFYRPFYCIFREYVNWKA